MSTVSSVAFAVVGSIKGTLRMVQPPRLRGLHVYGPPSTSQKQEVRDGDAKVENVYHGELEVSSGRLLNKTNGVCLLLQSFCLLPTGTTVTLYTEKRTIYRLPANRVHIYMERWQG
jgi:hypothetical protein